MTALNRRFRAIIDLQNEILAAGLDKATIMHLVVTRLPDLIPAATGAVVEIRDDHEMVYEAASGSASRFLGLRLALDGSMSGLCVRTAKNQYSHDTEIDERVDREACRKVGARSMICHPLIAAGDVAVGVLKVLSNQPAAFGEEDADTIDLLSSIIAAAINHANLFVETFIESRHDALTKLGNRRAFDDCLGTLVEESRARESAIALMMIDLDGLKAINDTLGHAFGDDTLRRFADAMRFSARLSDSTFRLGGDEFAILMPRCTEQEAARVADRISKTLEDRGISGCRFSFGVAQLEGNETHEAFVVRADGRMYAMKRARKAPPIPS
jgi:diguanylate cyclase